MAIFTRDSIVVANQESGKITMPHTEDIANYATPSAIQDVSSIGANGDTEAILQNSASQQNLLYGAANTRAGVYVSATSVLMNRTISNVEFNLSKQGSPTGTVTANVRKVSDDSIVGTLGTIDISTLSITPTWTMFNDASVSITEAVYITIEYSGGDVSNRLLYSYRQAEVYDSTNTSYFTYNGSYSITSAWDMGFRLEATSQIPLTDNDTATFFETQPEINPYYVVDAAGSDVNLVGVAIYHHANTTETEITIDTAVDGAPTTFTNVRTIDTSLLIAGAWNYIRFNAQLARYIRVRGNSGNTLVLATNEIKYRAASTNELSTQHLHITFDESNASLGLSGT